MTNKEYNLIIVGAGSAGCLAAYMSAKEGLENILLIDRKKRNQIGNKICGDGIGTKHLDFLQELDFPIKENNVVSNQIKNALIIAPNKQEVSNLPVEGKLSIINRYKFGQTLLEGALEEGVELLDNTIFTDVERLDKKMKITVKTNSAKQRTLTTPLLIDASGINSKIREQSGFFDDYAKLKDDEQYYCYREINKIKDLDEKYSDKAIFEFSFEKTKGGYIWFFSRGENEINMGTGIPKSWITKVKPKDIYEQEINPRFPVKTKIEYGGGFVPTRQPMPTHVKDNMILIGDAGTIVNPLHGGGLSPSLASGYIAGKLAANLIPKETVTEKDLWLFNLQIFKRYSLRYSILDLYRILLQNIPDNELLHALSNKYLPLGKIFYAREYELLTKLSTKLSEVWQQLPNKRFSLLPQYINQVKEVTADYPQTPENLDSWAQRYLTIYQNYQKEIRLK